MFLRVAALVSLLSVGHTLPEKTLLDGSAQPCADVKETTSGIPGVGGSSSPAGSSSGWLLKVES